MTSGSKRERTSNQLNSLSCVSRRVGTAAAGSKYRRCESTRADLDLASQSIVPQLDPARLEERHEGNDNVYTVDRSQLFVQVAVSITFCKTIVLACSSCNISSKTPTTAP